ncbi:MAG: GreA/GreB family elongation factor, partial [Lentisphaeria bacterium]|nr:GreA/GreB family elongation factor [Lentisphaeria bacterium]
PLRCANDGKETTYYLLGAWDGDPDKNYISYKTKIGEAMLDQQVGTAVDIPGIGKCTIKAVQPLPEELRKTLANEA